MVTRRLERIAGIEFRRPVVAGGAKRTGAMPDGLQCRSQRVSNGSQGPSSASPWSGVAPNGPGPRGAGRRAGHGGVQTDEGGRIPAPRGRGEPRTDEGDATGPRAGRPAHPFRPVRDHGAAETCKNNPFERVHDHRRGSTGHAAPRPHPFRPVCDHGAAESAKTIRSSMSVTTVGVASTPPRRGPIRSGRVVTTGPLKRAKTIRSGGPVTSTGTGVELRLAAALACCGRRLHFPQRLGVV